MPIDTQYKTKRLVTLSHEAAWMLDQVAESDARKQRRTFNASATVSALIEAEFKRRKIPRKFQNGG